MAEIYGEGEEQRVADEVWLRRCADEGWVALMKDDRIRRRPAETLAVEESGVRAFCLTNGNLKLDEMCEWFVTNIHRIIQRSRRPGPFIDGVYADRVERLWSPSD